MTPREAFLPHLSQVIVKSSAALMIEASEKIAGLSVPWLDGQSIQTTVCGCAPISLCLHVPFRVKVDKHPGSRPPTCHSFKDCAALGEYLG